MISSRAKTKLIWIFVLVTLVALTLGSVPARANNTPDVLPFSQDWSNTGLIIADDNWSGVPSIIGYRGDGLTAATGVDPRTVLAGDDPGVMDVIANQTATGLITGGVAEFDGIANPTVALQGSGTARAPYIKIFLDTTNANQIQISYNVRDIDGSTDNAVQQVALQYRVGSSGNYTNIPGGYIADATTGPSLATLVTPVSLTLPAAVNGQSHVELRIITTDAVGFDEWVGIDDISITANYAPTGYTLSPSSVLENQPTGTTVGTLTVTDANSSDTHTFTLVSTSMCAGNGADNVNFSISGNLLRTATSFDYETRASYAVCIQATDNYGLSYTAQQTITIGNILDETLAKTLPASGFPMERIANPPPQPADKTYASYSDLRLEIPKLTVSTSIVGVPLSQDGWDVTWLGDDAGWLNGTAFPTWTGNSVITGHVWDAYNQPGIFHDLKKLGYGDVIKIHAFGQVYMYEVRESKRIAPNNISAALQHEEKAWLTLVTCEDYKVLFKTYNYRRIVRAVLISVATEK